MQKTIAFVSALTALLTASAAHAQGVAIEESSGLSSPMGGEFTAYDAAGHCEVPVVASDTYVKFTVFGPWSGTLSRDINISAFKKPVPKSMVSLASFTPTADGIDHTSDSGSVNKSVGAQETPYQVSYPLASPGPLYGTAVFSVPQGTNAYAAQAKAYAHGSYTGLAAHTGSTTIVDFTVKPKP